MFFSKQTIKNFSLALSASLSLGVLSAISSVNAQPKPTNDNQCIPLREVTTDKTEIRKQVQVTLLRRDNWNTDFGVPGGKNFSFFVGNMTPENTANYDVTINLLFANGATESAFSRNVPMQKGETYSLTFQSSTGQQPFRINARIGGANNNAYTISVAACP